MADWFVHFFEVVLRAFGAPAAPQASEQMDRGWRVERAARWTLYEGDFQIFRPGGGLREHVRGRIIEWQGLPTDVYLQNPPAALRTHRHGMCLQLCDPADGWFKLHWERPPRDFDTSRAYVEQLLDEAFAAHGNQALPYA
jgi:hypothetical protein